MTSENIYTALTELDPLIIDAAAPDVKRIPRRRRRWRRSRWAAMAACMCLVVILCARVAISFLPSQAGDPWRQGVLYSLSSYEDLPTAHTGLVPLETLTLTEHAAWELYYREGGSAEMTADWFSLLISDTIYGEGENDRWEGDIRIPAHRLQVNCFFDGRTEEEQKVDMVFTQEATRQVMVHGVEVQIARHPIAAIDYDYWYYAVFTYDGVVYDIRTKSNQADYMERILDEMLCTRA